MHCFEILADTFTRLSVFGSPEGSSDNFKTHENINQYFKRRHPIICIISDVAIALQQADWNKITDLPRIRMSFPIDNYAKEGGPGAV